MQDDITFHSRADATLNHWLEALDKAYEHGDIEDIELQQGVLTIRTATGRSFIVSKHGPSQQLWLASPLSGGLHFTHTGTQWQLADGRDFATVLTADLAASGVRV